MWVGALEADLLLPAGTASLKAKRSVVRPLLADLRRAFDVAVAEVGEQELHRRTSLGVAVVAPDAGHVTDVLDACERLLADRPETTLLAVRRRLWRPDDD